MNTDTQDSRDSEVRDIMIRCYDTKDDKKFFEIAGLTADFASRLQEKYTLREYQNTRLSLALGLATIPDDLDVRRIRFDFEGDDSIYAFALELRRRFLN
jgi:hypothetical protein